LRWFFVGGQTELTMVMLRKGQHRPRAGHAVATSGVVTIWTRASDLEWDEAPATSISQGGTACRPQIDAPAPPLTPHLNYNFRAKVL
jgi:hypothetical protein